MVLEFLSRMQVLIQLVLKIGWFSSCNLLESLQKNIKLIQSLMRALKKKMSLCVWKLKASYWHLVRNVCLPSLICGLKKVTVLLIIGLVKLKESHKAIVPTQIGLEERFSPLNLLRLWGESLIGKPVKILCFWMFDHVVKFYAAVTWFRTSFLKPRE